MSNYIVSPWSQKLLIGPELGDIFRAIDDSNIPTPQLDEARAREHTNIIDNLTKPITDFLNDLGDSISSAWASIQENFFRAANWAWSTIQSTASWTWKQIQSLATFLFDETVKFFNWLWPVIRDAGEWILTSIWNIVKWVWNTVFGFIQDNFEIVLLIGGTIILVLGGVLLIKFL